MAKKRNSVKVASRKPVREMTEPTIRFMTPQPVFVTLPLTEGTYEIVIRKKS